MAVPLPVAPPLLPLMPAPCCCWPPAERHARAAVITDASGAALRFCQQCTRLHPVEEFEGPKRSCVASLLRRMARKQRQQAEDKDDLAAVEAAGKRRTRGRTGKGRSAASAAGGAGSRGPDSGGAPYDWSSNSHGSGSYGDARSQPSGGSAGGSGSLGGSQGYLAPVAAPAVDLTGVPGMVPQPLPSSGPTAMPPPQLPPLGLGAPLPLQQLQPAGTASTPFNPFALGAQPPAAAAAQQPAQPAAPVGWVDPQGLLEPAAVRQLLQDGRMMGEGSAVLPHAGGALAAAPVPASNPALDARQPMLTEDELEHLLVSLGHELSMD